MQKLWLATLLFALPLQAEEHPSAYPLWDGRESVEAYAKRAHLPATKSFNLSTDYNLEMVLVPAGQFMMGTPEPHSPEITADSAVSMIWIGAILTASLLFMRMVAFIRNRKRSFSLRWLLAATIAVGIFAGGFARLHLAKQAASRYETAMDIYRKVPCEIKPARSMLVAQPFYMGKYTVTQAQYAVVMPHGANSIKGPRYPAEDVSWGSAVDFCLKLDYIFQDHLGDGANFQLPTELQWEFACRAGTATAFNVGETLSTDDANFKGSAPSPSKRGLGIDRGCSTPVGSFKPNAFGLYDMHGNVWQWCANEYAARGGSWEDHAGWCRSACRKLYSANYAFSGFGFRVILTIPPRGNSR